MNHYTSFGLEVRQELLKKNKNLTWLAEQIGCSNGHLSEMLKGSRDVTNWKEKIKEVLDRDEDAGTTTP